MTETKAGKNNCKSSLCENLAKTSSISIPDFKGHVIFWLLAAGGLILDLWSKNAVSNWLEQEPDRSYSVIDGFLNLIMAKNDGAAWSILSGKTFFLVMVSVVAIVLILVLFFFSGKQSRLIHISMGLFAAGVTGNLYDRIFNDGLVRDFIDVYYRNYHWPTFNIADSLLCIGVVLLTISILFFEISSRKQKHAA